ncbi:unnamed protein product [Trichogramma brassicae]|uniref:Uncharacterized protein n=1 Tax=Trichogramma brassicae TaxID=86971 RepID=A0A6H5IX69_9HYME|nr:unnamed protein product [Trichogramma brassicae]
MFFRGEKIKPCLLNITVTYQKEVKSGDIPVRNEIEIRKIGEARTFKKFSRNIHFETRLESIYSFSQKTQPIECHFMKILRRTRDALRQDPTIFRESL